MRNLMVDLKYNRRNSKGLFIVSLFRISNICHRLSKKNFILLLLLFPVLVFYKIFTDYIFCIHLPPEVSIGHNFKLYHAFGTVVHGSVKIGNYCTIRHNTTIGNDGSLLGAAPVIGNNVDIGAGVNLIGAIRIGDNVKIGAGVTITKDIPSNTTVVGQPFVLRS